MSHLIISEHQFISSALWNSSYLFNIQLPQWLLRKNVSGCSYLTPSSPASSGSLLAHQRSLMRSDNLKLDNWGNDIGESKSRSTSKELEPTKWIQYTTTNGVSGIFAIANLINDDIVTIILYENQTLAPVTNIKNSIDGMLFDTQGHKIRTVFINLWYCTQIRMCKVKLQNPCLCCTLKIYVHFKDVNNGNRNIAEVNTCWCMYI